MSKWEAEIRRREAALRREEREEKKEQRKLEQRRREQARLSALDQARLEVESYNNKLEILLSIHKDRSEPIDWRKLAFTLSQHPPLKLARCELAALLQIARDWESGAPEISEAALEEARRADEQAYQSALAQNISDSSMSEPLHALARRVLRCDPRAYSDALSNLSALGEVGNLGSSIHFTVHNARTVECTLDVNGKDTIPSETKSLTATGKVAVKTMPKAEFHEIYQDYVCSCVLRVARELFALLPIDLVLITARVDGVDTQTGHPAKLPVLSLVAPREFLESLRFETLDPSDSLANFQHRGDVMASRRSGEFLPIVPLSLFDVSSPASAKMNLSVLSARAKDFRAEMVSSLKRISETSRATLAS